MDVIKKTAKQLSNNITPERTEIVNWQHRNEERKGDRNEKAAWLDVTYLANETRTVRKILQITNTRNVRTEINKKPNNTEIQTKCNI